MSGRERTWALREVRAGGVTCGAGAGGRLTLRAWHAQGLPLPRTSWCAGRRVSPTLPPDTTQQGAQGNCLNFLPDVYLLTVSAKTLQNSFAQ